MSSPMLSLTDNLILFYCQENRACEVLSPRQEGRQVTQQALRQLADKQTGPKGDARSGDRLTWLYEIFVSVIVCVCVLGRICVRRLYKQKATVWFKPVDSVLLLHTRPWPNSCDFCLQPGHIVMGSVVHSYEEAFHIHCMYRMYTVFIHL